MSAPPLLAAWQLSWFFPSSFIWMVAVPVTVAPGVMEPSAAPGVVTYIDVAQASSAAMEPVVTEVNGHRHGPHELGASRAFFTEVVDGPLQAHLEAARSWSRPG